MVKKFKAHLNSVLALLCSCTANTNWAVSTIATGVPLYDSSRLKYISKEVHSPIQFELVKIGNEVEAFLSLERFHFTHLSEIKVEFKIEDQFFEDLTSVHEGAMRIRLHPETTKKLIQALQDGSQVVILVDGFEESLDGKNFSRSFSQFLGEGLFFQNLF